MEIEEEQKEENEAMAKDDCGIEVIESRRSAQTARRMDT